MSPENPNQREQLEARLTALLLGELPADEAFALGRMIEQDTELAKTFERLKQTIKLVKETEAAVVNEVQSPAPMKMSAEKREALLRQFKTVKPKVFAEPKRRNWRILEVAAVLAVLAVLSAMLLPAVSRSKAKAQRYAANKNLEELGRRASESGEYGEAVRSAPPPATLSVRRADRIHSGHESKSEHSDVAAAGAVENAPVASPPIRVTLADASVQTASGRTITNSGALTVDGDGPVWNGVAVPQKKLSELALSGGTRGGGVPLPNLRSPIVLPPSNEVAQQNAIAPGATRDAQLMYELGKYDEAKAKANLALSQDSQNEAARYYLDRIENDRFKEHAANQDLFARKQLDGVEKEWIMADNKTKAETPAQTNMVLAGKDFSFFNDFNGNRRTEGTAMTVPSAAPIDPATALPTGTGEVAVNGTFGLSTAAEPPPTPASGMEQRYYRLNPHVVAEKLREPTTSHGLEMTNAPVATSGTADIGGIRSVTRTNEVAAIQEAVRRQLLTPAGVTLDSTKGETAYYDDRSGTIIVKGTSETQDKMRALASSFGNSGSATGTASSSIVLPPNSADFSFNTSAAPGPIENYKGSTVNQNRTRSAGEMPRGATALMEGRLGERSREVSENQHTPSNVYSLKIVGYADIPSAGTSGEQDKKFHEQKKDVAQLEKKLAADAELTPGTRAPVAQNAVSDNAAKQPAEDKPLPKPVTPPPTPQPELEAAANPFSTFSLNVSDVAFKLAAASLEKGALPEPASIRSEEFINAFDYRDPEPPANVPVAFASERAQFPFAQNRDLLRFSIKTGAQGREAGKPLNLVLLVDNSGSMERADRVNILRESLRVLATQLKKQDRLSIVTFARAPHLRVDGISGDQAGQAADQVSSLTPEGGTNLEEGMNVAYQTAARHYMADGVNRIVLMTDGAANLGEVSPESLKQKVEANRKQGIALDCFGIGWEGYNDDLLEVLSRNGDGRYGFINTPEEASSGFALQLAGALHVAASDVKVQVEFNPKRTTAYRQIGYAKHQLTKEQFRDNTVDAAEIGAAEAGNALYVIQTNPKGEGPIATVRVRFKIPGTSDYREHEWTVAYTGTAAPLEQASPAMRLAAVASAFSEWLATSPYAAEVTPDLLLKYLSGVPEVYGADGRPKKLEWMVRQAGAVAGK